MNSQEEINRAYESQKMQYAIPWIQGSSQREGVNE
jgi:hypothetical protein